MAEMRTLTIGDTTYEIVDEKARNGSLIITQKSGDSESLVMSQKAVTELFETLMNRVRSARIGIVTLVASAWVGEDNLYSQVVDIEGVTENSQVDLTPNVQQLAIFYNKDLTFVTENDGGIVTVYAIGQKPTNDYTIQVTITEVDV